MDEHNHLHITPLETIRHDAKKLRTIIRHLDSGLDLVQDANELCEIEKHLTQMANYLEEAKRLRTILRKQNDYDY